MPIRSVRSPLHGVVVSMLAWSRIHTILSKPGGFCTRLAGQQDGICESLRLNRLGVLPDFNKLYEEMVAQIDGQKRVKVAEQIDRYVYDEALALFLCAPQALYAV